MEYSETFPAGGLDYATPMSRNSDRVIGWSKESWFTRKIIEDFLLIPGMIAGGNDRQSHLEQFFRQLRGNPKSPSYVFAVTNDDIDLPLSDQTRDGPSNGGHAHQGLRSARRPVSPIMSPITRTFIWRIPHSCFRE